MAGRYSSGVRPSGSPKTKGAFKEAAKPNKEVYSVIQVFPNKRLFILTVRSREVAQSSLISRVTGWCDQRELAWQVKSTYGGFLPKNPAVGRVSWVLQRLLRRAGRAPIPPCTSASGSITGYWCVMPSTLLSWRRQSAQRWLRPYPGSSFDSARSAPRH